MSGVDELVPRGLVAEVELVIAQGAGLVAGDFSLLMQGEFQSFSGSEADRSLRNDDGLAL